MRTRCTVPVLAVLLRLLKRLRDQIDRSALKIFPEVLVAEGFTRDDLLNRLRGISPADLQGVVNTAKRMAMNRMKASDEALAPLIWEDFEQALERTRSKI